MRGCRCYSGTGRLVGPVDRHSADRAAVEPLPVAAATRYANQQAVRRTTVVPAHVCAHIRRSLAQVAADTRLNTNLVAEQIGKGLLCEGRYVHDGVIGWLDQAVELDGVGGIGGDLTDRITVLALDLAGLVVLTHCLRADPPHLDAGRSLHRAVDLIAATVHAVERMGATVLRQLRSRVNAPDPTGCGAELSRFGFASTVTGGWQLAVQALFDDPAPVAVRPVIPIRTEAA